MEISRPATWSRYISGRRMCDTSTCPSAAYRESQLAGRNPFGLCSRGKGWGDRGRICPSAGLRFSARGKSSSRDGVQERWDQACRRGCVLASTGAPSNADIILSGKTARHHIRRDCTDRGRISRNSRIVLKSQLNSNPNWHQERAGKGFAKKSGHRYRSNSKGGMRPVGLGPRSHAGVKTLFNSNLHYPCAIS